jgi:molybdenum cofactor cytidylyltransferase
MGRPKQLLPVAGRPLVRHVAEQALAAPAAPVIVVLGAHAEQIVSSLDGLPVQIVVNDRWERGMGSSLRAGMEALTAASLETKAVIVALADQPGCSAAHLARLIETYRSTGRTIVASATGEVRGPPVLFAAAWFHRLLQLDGDVGARELLREQVDALATVPLDAAADIDTPADYTSLLNLRSEKTAPGRSSGLTAASKK